MVFKSTIEIRPDKMAVVCFYCADKQAATDYFETCGYEVSHEICAKCIEKYKMDSLKGSRWSTRTKPKCKVA